MTESFESVEDLEDALTRPSPEDVAFAEDLEGDVLVLGAGGKMGLTVVGRICRALEEAGRTNRVFAASRFTEPRKARRLAEYGAEILRVDLMEDELSRLPSARNCIYMVGRKFGSADRPDATWAVNSYLPGRVARRFRESRMLAFSTGNVYPFVPVDSGGATEETPLDPVGEYGQSCLGRERIFEYFCHEHELPTCLFRLNYAVEPRYGVLVDVGKKVLSGTPVDLSAGYVNVIWQGDAASICFRALEACRIPAAPLNVTGPEILAVRDVAERFGELLGREPRFEGSVPEEALLSDAGRCLDRFGSPSVSAEEAIAYTADWLAEGRPTLGAPTKFERRDGQF